MFGCNAKGAEDFPIEWRYLCENPVIRAGGVHDGIIYVFRGGKQWKFNNRPKDDKPFGDLINGGYRAKTNWTDIYFPGGAGSLFPPSPSDAGTDEGQTPEGDTGGKKPGANAPGKKPTGPTGPPAFIMVYRTKWSKWMRQNKGPSNGDLRDLPIEERDDSDPELDNDSDLGALALVDKKKNKYRKVKGPNVCPIKIKNNVATWDGPCKPVGEEEHNYPPDIIAAIKTSDDFWYLVTREGKYCKRKENDTKSVSILSAE